MNFRKIFQLALAAAALTAVPGIARAQLIPLVFWPSPPVSNFFLQVNYNAGTNEFTANGYAYQFSYDEGAGLVPYGVQTPDDLYNFSITALIDNAGHLIGPGSLNITGTIPDLPANIADASTGSLL